MKEGIGLAELLRGIFPPGSVIGAPKIRAMELIRELETEPRGVYCGAIGHISPEGRALFNVAIRTAVIFRDAAGEMGIGSGIVFDSQGPKEYAECLLKMKFLTDPVKRVRADRDACCYEPERRLRAARAPHRAARHLGALFRLRLSTRPLCAALSRMP